MSSFCPFWKCSKMIQINEKFLWQHYVSLNITPMDSTNNIEIEYFVWGPSYHNYFDLILFLLLQCAVVIFIFALNNMKRKQLDCLYFFLSILGVSIDWFDLSIIQSKWSSCWFFWIIVLCDFFGIVSSIKNDTVCFTGICDFFSC